MSTDRIHSHYARSAWTTADSQPLDVDPGVHVLEPETGETRTVYNARLAAANALLDSLADDRALVRLGLYDLLTQPRIARAQAQHDALGKPLFVTGWLRLDRNEDPALHPERVAYRLAHEDAVQQEAARALATAAARQALADAR